jgi:hypothetical protein
LVIRKNKEELWGEHIVNSFIRMQNACVCVRERETERERERERKRKTERQRQNVLKEVKIHVLTTYLF